MDTGYNNKCKKKERQKNMKTAKEISSEWPEYDKMIALSQLTNYGVIYLDEYNLPIDDEYLLEELVKGEKNE